MLNVNPDRMRYQKNAFSFWLCMLALFANMIAFLVPYGSIVLDPDLLIGADILINIVFMLMVFMGSEKAKAYMLRWGYILIGIGVVQAVRILIVPTVFLAKKMLTGYEYTMSAVFLAVSAAALILAGVICITRSTILHKYLKEVEEKEKQAPTH